MDASSITEEDIMEICIRRAHAHPLGVLQYSVEESVILFGSLKDVNRAHCTLLDVTELCNEAVTVWTMALTEAHVAAFTTMWHSNPTSGDGEPHTPPQQSPPSEETPCHLHAQLGDLNDSELQQLIKDLSQEIMQCGLTAPPSNPPPHDWVCLLGSREPEKDDQEVTFPGGGRWGPERQTTPVLNSPAGGRVPSGPPQQSPCPAPAGPDMGQLISALTLGLQIGTPKICTFSGEVAPSKTEVSYKQWSHEVQCIKDHYPELVIRESIMQSLRGPVTEMACYMGPTAGVSDILDKLSVMFGTVMSFDILMQNFYKILQGNEKVPSFVTRLEGTLNQIRIKCPSRIANHEVPSHLKDQLFHGVKKHIRDSMRYLYSNPQTTYSKLVVTARRAESKTEETKVKARSAGATEVPSGSKELGNQIVRLMAALTRAEQSSCSASTPSSPRHRGCGRGWTDRNTSVCPNSHNGQTGLGQTSAHSSSIVNKTSTNSPHKGNQNMQTGVQGGTQGTWQCFRCQGWGHMARECATPAMQLNREGGPKGMQSTPLKSCTVSSKHSLCNPKPKPTQDKAVKQRGWKEIAPIPFLNPDPVAQLVGRANEAPVVVNGCKVATLVDLGAQVSNISAQLCEELGLKIQPLGQLLELEGTGGASLTSNL